MVPDEALQFALDVEPLLPPGWGWLSHWEDDGVAALVVQEWPLGGWMIWLAKPIVGGRILKGSVMFGPDDTRESVADRMWAVLTQLEREEKRDSSTWN